jgi:hypothetical protein
MLEVQNQGIFMLLLKALESKEEASLLLPTSSW